MEQKGEGRERVCVRDGDCSRPVASAQPVQRASPSSPLTHGPLPMPFTASSLLISMSWPLAGAQLSPAAGTQVAQVDSHGKSGCSPLPGKCIYTPSLGWDLGLCWERWLTQKGLKAWKCQKLGRQEG